MASEDFSAWIGRRLSVTDTLDPLRCNALDSSLGETRSLTVGDPLPPLRHWLHFWDIQAPVDLGADGHPARGGFLPPVDLPRRMWAGGRVRFDGTLRLGEPIERVSTIASIEAKVGRSGPLVFATIRHELVGGEGQVIEEQDIVYRDAAASQRPPAHVDAAPMARSAWHAEVTPDPVLLFRYSALTMNGHRIHYDRGYAIEEEGYPGLVVHGPLQATVLVNLAVRHASGPITGFTFRSIAPAFDGATLAALGEPAPGGASLRIEQYGVITMTATAEWGTP